MFQEFCIPLGAGGVGVAGVTGGGTRAGESGLLGSGGHGRVLGGKTEGWGGAYKINGLLAQPRKLVLYLTLGGNSAEKRWVSTNKRGAGGFMIGAQAYGEQSYLRLGPER